MIDGQSFRVDRKVKDTHFHQPVTDGLIVEDYYLRKTDREINALRRTNRLRHEEGYYTKSLSLLRVRHDNSDLSDLSESALRTVAWKKEWCVRFLRAAGGSVFPSGFEMLLVPGSFVAAAVHAPIGQPSGMLVPLGFASFDKLGVLRATQLLEENVGSYRLPDHLVRELDLATMPENGEAAPV